MLRFFQILVSLPVLGLNVLSLSACGQQGPLYLPTEPAAASRATLPETLMRSGSAQSAQPETTNAPSPAPSPVQ
jgi:predicted small lipoprotein YifL